MEKIKNTQRRITSLPTTQYANLSPPLLWSLGFILVVKMLCSICALELSSLCLLQDFAPAVICSPFYNTIFSSLGSNHSQQRTNMLWSFPSLNKTLITMASSCYDSIFFTGNYLKRFALFFCFYFLTFHPVFNWLQSSFALPLSPNYSC